VKLARSPFCACKTPFDGRQSVPITLDHTDDVCIGLSCFGALRVPSTSALTVHVVLARIHSSDFRVARRSNANLKKYANRFPTIS
jgi:hypothetical protein